MAVSPSVARLSRAALLLLATAAAGCATTPDHPPYTLDCSADDGYDIKILETYEAQSFTQNPSWFSFGDNTPDSGHSGQDGGTMARDIEGDAGRCGSHRALVLGTYGHNDYGSGFGDYHVGTDFSYPYPVDATGYDGISFWARSPSVTFNGVTTPSTKGVTLSLSDLDSSSVPDWEGGKCVDYSVDSGTVSVQVVDQNGNYVSGGTATNVRPANACGNTFDRALLTTDRWQFYTLPFSSFTQTADPSRIASGFDHKIFTLNVRFPKEARGELWLDDLGLYRKASGTGTKVIADRTCTKAPSDLISDFSRKCTSSEGGVLDLDCFGGPASSGVAGGTFVYPPIPGADTGSAYRGTVVLTAPSTDAGDSADASTPDAPTGGPGAFVLLGNLVTYSGFGTYLLHCIDASEFAGIQFKIGGDLGRLQMQTMTFTVIQRSNWSTATGGLCNPDAGDCKGAFKQFTVTPDPQVVQIRWTDLAGGVPVNSLDNPAELIQLQWDLPWGAGEPVPIHVTIDDLRFFK
jgi:hypothetical protein